MRERKHTNFEKEMGMVDDDRPKQKTSQGIQTYKKTEPTLVHAYDKGYQPKRVMAPTPMPFNHSNLNYLVSNGAKEDKDDLNTSTSREVSKTYRSNVFTDDGGTSPLGKKVFDHGKNSSNISNLFVPKDAEKVAVVPVK